MVHVVSEISCLFLIVRFQADCWLLFGFTEIVAACTMFLNLIPSFSFRALHSSNSTFHSAPQSFSLSLTRRAAIVFAGIELECPADLGTVATSALLISTNWASRVRVKNALKLLCPYIIRLFAKLLSSFVPSIEFRRKPCWGCAIGLIFVSLIVSVIFIVVRAFSQFFLSSNDLPRGDMKAVLKERWRFRLRNRWTLRISSSDFFLFLRCWCLTVVIKPVLGTFQEKINSWTL